MHSTIFADDFEIATVCRERKNGDTFDTCSGDVVVTAKSMIYFLMIDEAGTVRQTNMRTAEIKDELRKFAFDAGNDGQNFAAEQVLERR